MRYEVSVGTRTLRLDLDSAGRALVDGVALALELEETTSGRQWLARVGGRTHEITVLTHEPLRLLVDGREISAHAIDERALAATRGTRHHASGRHELRAPMPGLLRAVHVKEGDVVERDQPLITLEAMKMENELRAPARGRVTKLMATAGAKVDGGALLVVLAEAE